MRKRKNFFTKSMNGVMVAILIINIILIQYYGQQKKFYEERMQQLENMRVPLYVYAIGECSMEGKYYTFFVIDSFEEELKEFLDEQEKIRKSRMRQAFDSIGQKREKITMEEFLQGAIKKEIITIEEFLKME